MLLKLLANQVADKWDVIFPAVEIALPAIEDERERKKRELVLMQSFLDGSLTCWLIGEEKKILGVIVTSVIEDPGTKLKSLFVYSIYAYQFLSARSWVEVLKPLMKYARKEDCVNILAFSSVEKVIEIMNTVGADTQQRVLRLEVFQYEDL